MADQVALTAEVRDGNGKGEARALRRAGRTPGIAYGTGIEATPIHVDESDLRHALATDAGANVVLNLAIDGEKHLAMAREISRHPVKGHVVHLDFVMINRNEVVTVDVPLVFHGEVEEGVITHTLNSLSIEVLPLEVPSEIEVTVGGMAVGDLIRAGEIPLPKGVTLLTDPEETVVSIAAETVQEELEEEGAEGEAATPAAEGGDAAGSGDAGGE